MIRNQWYAVMESREVPGSRPVNAKRFGEKMVFFRTKQGIACIADRCCHRGASLSCGRLVEGKLECPFHGFQFDETGRVALIPAYGRAAKVPDQFKVKSYPVREKHGFIFLWWGEEVANLPEISFFDELGDAFAISTIRQYWPVHYSRAIENQLDAVHLPFVHKTTIGWGGRTLVHGPSVTLVGNKLSFSPFNEVDDGVKTSLRAQDIAGHKQTTGIEFIFPNLWQNLISAKFRIVAVFVPVDESNTIIYVRSYQSLANVFGLRRLIGWFNNRLNHLILSQDRRVVITQEPIVSHLHMDEKLIQGDRPIAEYRRHRDHLMKNS